MGLRRALVPLAAMASLSGCTVWSGPPFYSLQEVDPQFLSGAYRSSSDGRISGYWDGKTWRDPHPNEGNSFVTLAIPFPSAVPGLYVVQSELNATSDGTDKPWAYYSLAKREGDKLLIVRLDCATTELIVRGAGGIMDPPPPMTQRFIVKRWSHGVAIGQIDPKQKHQSGGQACHFQDRSSFEVALRRYLAERQLIGDTLEHVGK